MRCWVVALALCACGDVNVIEKPAPPDAFQPDSVPMVTCGSGEMVCNGATCANTMTDEANCGGCDVQCAPTQTCEAGTCTAVTTCRQVKDLNPTAPDDVYRTPSNGAFYCDFTNNAMYDAFAFGTYNVAYPDYTFMATTDFTNATIQKAFVAVFNAQGGLINLAVGSTSGNCCFKSADAGVNQMLLLGGNYVYPAAVATATQQCGGPYNDARIRWQVQTTAEFAPIPMPANYWATHVPTFGNMCGDGNNPGIFMRKTPAM